MEPNQPLQPTPNPTTQSIPDETPATTTPQAVADTSTPSVQAATPVAPSQTPEPAASQRRLLFKGLSLLCALALLAAIVLVFMR